MTSVAERTDTESATSPELRAEPPQRCPKCGKQRLARRPREADERQFTRMLGKVIKIRPYRCSSCKHQTWKLRGWTASPLLTLILTLGTLLLASLIGFMVWLTWQPEHFPTASMHSAAPVPATIAPAVETSKPPAESPETAAPDTAAPEEMAAPAISAEPSSAVASEFRLESVTLKK